MSPLTRGGARPTPPARAGRGEEREQAQPDSPGDRAPGGSQELVPAHPDPGRLLLEGAPGLGHVGLDEARELDAGEGHLRRMVTASRRPQAGNPIYLCSVKHSRTAEPIRDDLAELRRDPRQAVREEEIVCLVCGRAFRQLTNTHPLSHGLTSSDYKSTHGYNPGRALMCHALRRAYAARAERIRLRPIVARPERRRRGGARRIRLEEFLTRREIQRHPRARWDRRDGSGRFTTESAAADG